MQDMIKKLDKAEILRYLGYRGVPLPQHISDLIDSCMDTTIKTITPKYLYRSFPIHKVNKGIAVEGCGMVLSGKNIEKHLSQCDAVYLLCVTIGLEIEKIIRVAMLTSPDAGVIYDSCASTAVEAAADYAEELIRAECAQNGKNITSRFSPGYGDFPLDTQKELLFCMDSHRKIGLGVTDSFLLTPNKSVTAIIGVTAERCPESENKNKCDTCDSRDNCSFCTR